MSDGVRFLLSDSESESGEPRGCMVRELEPVIQLCNLVFRPSGGDMGQEYPLLFHPDNTNRLRTVWEGERVVSHAGYVHRDAYIYGVEFHTAAVGAVCTHPEYRGKGLASRVMEDLEQSARDEGCDLMLVSGSRSLYRRMGCIRAGTFRTYRLKPTPDSQLRHVRPATPEDARTLVRLYQAEPVRFERSVDDWRLMLECRMLMNRRAQTWLIERNDRPVAYVGVQLPGEDGVARIQEYAGSRTAIWQSLGEVMRNARELDLTLMPGDQEMELLVGQGVPYTEHSFAGTIKILNPETFFEKAQTLLFERVAEDVANDMVLSSSNAEDSITFDWQSQYLDVPTAELASFVFGPAPGEAPIPLPEDPLGQILRDLFPLPLLWYGYNYI